MVDSPGMNLIYFPVDWAHFDLLFMDRVRVIDTASQKVVAQSKCFIKTHKRPGLLTHDELLADNAAALKQLIKDKAAECTAKMKADLKL